nr:MAG TPA: hypothetical protein [Caudoviricetes sp.]DAP59665.1 MAG TPA: hypothetical protein [Caudoviricetes sp.]
MYILVQCLTSSFRPYSLKLAQCLIHRHPWRKV